MLFLEDVAEIQKNSNHNIQKSYHIAWTPLEYFCKMICYLKDRRMKDVIPTVDSQKLI